MHSTEKQVYYEVNNSYSTFHSLNKQTQHVWLAFHGLGYLSRYFIQYFRNLPENDYIICPQAPSKYYQGKDFKYVGASWLTKENTQPEMQNLIRYINAIEKNEIPIDIPIKLFGYSQGVSIAMRWLASGKKNVSHLIVHSGSIPKELKASDFEAYPNLRVDLIYGTKDEYLTEEKLAYQHHKAKELFGNRVHVHAFDGVHEVNSNLFVKLAKNEL